MSDDSDIGRRLAEPFDPKVIGWKPQSAKGNRALAVAYIDARDVMDRLDAVIGVGGWSDQYEQIAAESVMCKLRVKIDGEWVEKCDVGSTSDQPDAGDKLKAAFSDALKRAAVKFGIGRYLYSLPAVWCDYDPQKKQFTSTPQLPFWAVPQGQQRPSAPQQQQPATAPPKQPAKPAAKPQAATVRELWEGMGRGTPKNGVELLAWLASADQALVRLLAGEYTPGGLAAHVVGFCKRKQPADLADLPAQDIGPGWNAAKQYVKALETPAGVKA